VHNDTDVAASIESSLPDDTHVHEMSTSDFEHKTEIDSTVITTSLLSSSLSLEFVAMIHQVPSGASSFSSYLVFVPKSTLLSIGFDVCPPRHPIYSLFPSSGVMPTSLHLHVTHDNITRQLASCNYNNRFSTCPYSILQEFAVDNEVIVMRHHEIVRELHAWHQGSDTVLKRIAFLTYELNTL